MTRRIRYFPVQRIHVATELQPNGEYTAIDDDSYDGPGSAMGRGKTELEAIADLRDQLIERGLIEPLGSLPMR